MIKYADKRTRTMRNATGSRTVEESKRERERERERDGERGGRGERENEKCIANVRTTREFLRNWRPLPYDRGKITGLPRVWWGSSHTTAILRAPPTTTEYYGNMERGILCERHANPPAGWMITETTGLPGNFQKFCDFRPIRDTLDRSFFILFSFCF